MWKPPIDRESIVRTVMDTHPETVAVFLSRRMHCPGCVMAPFMTLEEAAASYGVDASELVADLRAVVPHREPGART